MWIPKFELSEGEPKAPPANIIRIDQDWSVRFIWTTKGPLNYLMGGIWFLKFYLERMGPGADPDLPERYGTLSEKFASEPWPYTCVIKVPKGLVQAGLYKIVASVTMLGPSNKPGPIAGFAEGGLVQFYDGGPIPLTGV